MACSKYELGYDHSRFEVEVSESFHCIICFLVLKHPVMCKNQHYYCLVCIKKHLETSASCPTCRDHLTVDTLNSTPRIVTDYLSELNIRCDFYPRGCLEIMKLKNLEQHVASCGFSPVQCSNDGCDAVISLRDKIHHQSEVCEFRKSKCHDCGQLKQEVKELRVQMLAQQDQIKKEMKGIKEQVKNEVKEEIKKLTAQIFSRQGQMKKEIKQDIARQELTTTKIKPDLTEMKDEILSEVRELVRMAVDQINYNMEKKMKNTSDEMKKEIKEVQEQVKLLCFNQSAKVDGERKKELPAAKDTRVKTPSNPFSPPIIPNETKPKYGTTSPNRPNQTIPSFGIPAYAPRTCVPSPNKTEETAQSFEIPPQNRQNRPIQSFGIPLQFEQLINETEPIPSFGIPPTNRPLQSFVIPPQNRQKQPTELFRDKLQFEQLINQTGETTPSFEILSQNRQKQPIPLFGIPLQFEQLRNKTEEPIPSFGVHTQPNTPKQPTHPLQFDRMQLATVDETMPSFGTRQPNSLSEQLFIEQYGTKP